MCSGNDPPWSAVAWHCFVTAPDQATYRYDKAVPGHRTPKSFLPQSDQRIHSCCTVGRNTTSDQRNYNKQPRYESERKDVRWSDAE